MGNNNGGNWDKNFVIALVTFIVGTIVALATPEIRQCIGLEDPPTPQPVYPPIEGKKPIQPAVPEKPKPEPVTPTQPPVEKTTTQFSYILYENGPQDVETADATLSFSVTTINKESIVSLHIVPKGRKSSDHAVWTGDSVEFSSAAGDFLVQILKVDLDSGIIGVQVSRKL